jgi:hypothetical protein
VPVASLHQFSDYLMQNSQRPFIALEEGEITARGELRRLPASGEATLSAATHYALLPNSTAFDIHAPSAGVVCLSESQSRDFTATANGEPKEVLTVNECFKGVYLDRAGDYHIEFRFRPRYWGTAFLLFWSAVGGVLLIAAGRVLRRKTAKSGEGA